MKIIESSKIKEKAYVEKLESGMQVIIIPKQHTKKKYVIWGTHFGSIDNHFIMPKTGEEVYIPDGVAHFLEHKMFEQPDGTNSLDTLMALGIDANLYGILTDRTSPTNDRSGKRVTWHIHNARQRSSDGTKTDHSRTSRTAPYSSTPPTGYIALCRIV